MKKKLLPDSSGSFLVSDWIRIGRVLANNTRQLVGNQSITERLNMKPSSSLGKGKNKCQETVIKYQSPDLITCPHRLPTPVKHSPTHPPPSLHWGQP